MTTFRIGVTVFFLASAACGLAPHGPSVSLPGAASEVICHPVGW